MTAMTVDEWRISVIDSSNLTREEAGQAVLQWVSDAIARLPDALRQTLILAYHQVLKYREIAEILKIPVGTVKSRLHAARAALLSHLVLKFRIAGQKCLHKLAGVILSNRFGDRNKRQAVIC